MQLTAVQKTAFKKEIVACLTGEPEIRKIVVFGSFLKGGEVNDLDIAVFQVSDEPYLALAMKYRQRTRSVARMIPLDIFPVRPDAKDGSFLDIIAAGEVIYER